MIEREFFSVDNQGSISTERFIPRRKEKLERKGPPPPSFKGKHHTVESITRIKAANKGKKRSPETRKKMTAENRRRWKNPDYLRRMQSQEITDQRRKNIRKAMKRKWKSKKYSETVTLQNKYRNVPAIIESSVLDLWQYAQEHGLLPKMVEQGILKKREGQMLEGFFARRRGLFPEELFNRFSIGVANLA